MLLSNAEALALTGLAVLVAGAILMAIADTPLYPIAFGIELIVLFYLLSLHGQDISAKVTSLLHMGGLS
jgi:hypothetical protein